MSSLAPVAVSACDPSGVTEGTHGDGALQQAQGLGSKDCFAAGNVRSEQISVSSVSPGLVLQQLGGTEPIQPQGSFQSQKILSHSAFLECFWHKSSTFPQCFPGSLSVPGSISPLQSCHREKKLTQAAGGSMGNNLRILGT